MYLFGDYAKETLEQLSGKGAFLTVKKGDKINTMTIGWGSLSQYWGYEVFIAPVRTSRYTFEMLKDADEFTVSVPLLGEMSDELKYCGSHSGRNEDKIAAAGLKTKNSKTVSAPLIDGCAVYYECKVMGKKPLTKDDIAPEDYERWYPTGDMHTLFFGRILSCHR